MSTNRRRHWLNKTCACGETIYYLPEWQPRPTQCDDCRAAFFAKKLKPASVEEAQSFPRNDASRYCDECLAEITYDVGAGHAPKYCKSCQAKKQPGRAKKVCNSCGQIFSYPQESANPPANCKTCYQKFLALKVDIFCIKCHDKIEWNLLWIKPDKFLPKYCVKCLQEERAYIVDRYRSRVSYRLQRDQQIYIEAGQTDHFLNGYSDSHHWEGKFAEMSFEEIVNAAVDLAESTEDHVLEFENRNRPRNQKRVIKYDMISKLVVVFCPETELIVTTYVMKQGFAMVMHRITNGDWIPARED